MNRAVFLDLNGTLVMPVKVNNPHEYIPIVSGVEAVRLLNTAGFICPVISVQSRIERNVFTREAFDEWFHGLQTSFAESGAFLEAAYICPHSSRSGCECHKPKLKLYLDAIAELNIDPTRSYVVGDTYADIQAGQAIGAKTCFVRTGWADRHLAEHGHEADFVGDAILAVACWIIEDSNHLKM